jgi:Amt family ammonium transporter
MVAAVTIVVTYSFVGAWLILKIIDKFERVRVPDAVEMRGLDSEIHGEAAYVLD